MRTAASPATGAWWAHPFATIPILLLFWGSFAAVSQIALGDMDSHQVQFYMFASASLILTVIYAFTGKFKALFRLPAKAWGGLALLGVPSYLYYMCFILALNMIPPIEAAMLNYSFPIFMMLLAVPILGEKMTVVKAACALIGFVGMVLIVANGQFEHFRFTNWQGDATALIGAVCWALFSNLGKKVEVDPVLSVYIYTLVGTILSGVMVTFYSGWVWPDRQPLLGVIWMGSSTFVVGYYLWFRLLRTISASQAASVSFLIPFFSLLYIVVLLDEQMSWNQLQGFGLIAMGVFIQFRMEKKTPTLSRKKGNHAAQKGIPD